MTIHTLDYPLSNVDLNDAIDVFDARGANIKNDTDIKPNTDIESIFNNRGHCILFHKYPNAKVGHWYTIIRNRNKTATIFDSLGQKPQYYSKHLIPFLKNNGIKQVIYNSKALQGETSVCGRYALCIICLNKIGANIDDIYKFFEDGKKKHGSYDKYVLHITSKK